MQANQSIRILISVSLLATLLATVLGAAAQAHDPRERVRITSRHGFQATLKKLQAAAKKNKIGIVNRASAQAGAKKIGVTIPGNQVWGLYHPRFAVRMLKASTEAGYEAPIRLYITESDSGRVTVSYIKPSKLFAPYGNMDLDDMAKELDAIFSKVANSVR
jgi:uncharacterized protein (DUF302 family)